MCALRRERSIWKRVKINSIHLNTTDGVQLFRKSSEWCLHSFILWCIQFHTVNANDEENRMLTVRMNIVCEKITYHKCSMSTICSDHAFIFKSFLFIAHVALFKPFLLMVFFTIICAKIISSSDVLLESISKAANHRQIRLHLLIHRCMKPISRRIICKPIKLERHVNEWNCQQFCLK